MKTLINRPIQVLLVEDNPGDARLLQEILADVTSAEFELTLIDRLEVALQWLNTNNCDIILLDLSLPDSHGLETVVRTCTQAPTIPIIVLTGLDDETLALSAMQEGAQDYLVKGQQVDSGNMLVRSMRYAIERKQAEQTLKRQIERERLVTAIAQHIRQSLNLNEILNTTVEEVRQFLQVDRVLIYYLLTDNSGKVINEAVLPEYPVLLGKAFSEEAFPKEAHQAYYQGKIRAITDIEQDNIEPCQAEFLRQLGVKAKLVVPILQGTNLWGLLIAHQCIHLRQWQPLEIELLQQLATQVGIAVQQSELYQQVQTELMERKLSEQIIREQASLLDISTDAILVRDLEHRILFWNRGAERLYGWLVEDVLHKNVNKILYREFSPELQTALQVIVEKGEWQGELHKVTKEGKDIIVASRWSLARDAAGEPKSILTVDTDITEKKQLEAQFLRAQRLESLGTLASGIAHDLNNMLTPILASSELLQMRIPKDDALTQKLLKIIESSSGRGADLVRQVLSFTRGIEGKHTNLSVKHLIVEIKQIISQTFPKSIKFTSNMPADLWAVSADATQLHQVLINLAVNARDAMPNGGNLDITATNLLIDETFARIHLEARVGQYVAITISDSGIGIAPEILERIFEPFFTTKEIGKGTGLGLSTAIGIIKSHSGFVTVSSQVGKGTEFKLFLPAILEVEQSPVKELELPMGNGELILIVDDESSIREITQISLGTYNYRTILASDGMEAIAQYSQHQHEIALVLMDMMMPSMGGAAAIRTLQTINPQVKIVAISGVASTEVLAQTAGSGVKAFLSKPCTAKALLTTLHGILKETKIS
jgi:two-component system, cell cycle sensor histidine kinase and response regulator CckA